MRPSLTWALVATLAACAVAVWLPEAAPRTVAAVERPAAPGVADGPMPPAVFPERGTALPEQLSMLVLEPAARDIFAPVAVTAEAAPAPPVAVAQSTFIDPPAPVAPTAPAAAYRFLGRMLTPVGESMVFLGSTEKVVAVKAGDRLDDGYVVESISEQGVQLLYPELDVRITLPAPSVPGS